MVEGEAREGKVRQGGKRLLIRWTRGTGPYGLGKEKAEM